MSMFARLTGVGTRQNDISLPYGYLLPLLELYREGEIDDRKLFAMCNVILRQRSQRPLSFKDRQSLRRLAIKFKASSDPAYFGQRLASLTTAANRRLIAEREWKDGLGV